MAHVDQSKMNVTGFIVAGAAHNLSSYFVRCVIFDERT